MQGIFKDLLRPLTVTSTGLVPRGALRKPVKAVLFDIYGTLLISGSGDIQASGSSAPDTLERLQRVLQEYHIATPIEALQEQLRKHIHHTHALLRQKGILFPEVRIEVIWQKILGCPLDTRLKKFALAYELLVNPVWPMPHLVQLLESCRMAGLSLGLISNAQFYTPSTLCWFLKSDLTAAGFDRELRIFSFEAGCAKPSLDLFEIALGRLARGGIAAGETVYVGNDMRNDIRPARQVGFQTVLFAGDRRSLRLRLNNPDCSGLQPDLVVTHLSQLQAALAG